MVIVVKVGSHLRIRIGNKYAGETNPQFSVQSFRKLPTEVAGFVVNTVAIPLPTLDPIQARFAAQFSMLL
jgi:hypothetical protein